MYQDAENTESNDLSNDQEQVSDNSREESGEQSNVQDMVDLSKYSRVKLGEKEWSRDELEKGVMFQSDYTKKTQEIAQERRYVDNLQADLSAVAKNPALAGEFRSIYPEKFHKLLDIVTRETNSQARTQGNQSQNSSNQNVVQKTDPRLEKMFSTVESLQKERHEERVSQKATEIDSAFAKFSSKFPLSTPNGDETFVLSRAQAVLDSGETLNDAKWEKIFKDSHLHFEKAYQGFYKTKINNQKAAHIRGKDVASGGGTPGGAPNLPKTIKEATRVAMQDLTQNK
jgi:hypothetical protein